MGETPIPTLLADLDDKDNKISLYETCLMVRNWVKNNTEDKQEPTFNMSLEEIRRNDFTIFERR